MLKENIAKNIRSYRKSLNLSQIKLAELANVHKKTVIRAESGKSELKLEVIEKISNALGIEADRVFEPVDEKEIAEEPLKVNIVNKIKFLDEDKLKCVDKIINAIRNLK